MCIIHIYVSIIQHCREQSYLYDSPVSSTPSMLGRSLLALLFKSDEETTVRSGLTFNPLYLSDLTV